MRTERQTNKQTERQAYRHADRKYVTHMTLNIHCTHHSHCSQSITCVKVFRTLSFTNDGTHQQLATIRLANSGTMERYNRILFQLSVYLTN